MEQNTCIYIAKSAVPSIQFLHLECSGLTKVRILHHMSVDVELAHNSSLRIEICALSSFSISYSVVKGSSIVSL